MRSRFRKMKDAALERLQILTISACALWKKDQ
jgi:hypothetical protein